MWLDGSDGKQGLRSKRRYWKTDSSLSLSLSLSHSGGVYMGRCHSGVVCTLEGCVSTDLCTLEYWASFFPLILSLTLSLFSSGGRNSGKAVEGNFFHSSSLSHTHTRTHHVYPLLVCRLQWWPQTLLVFVWMCDLDSEKEICCKMAWPVPLAPQPLQRYQTSMR